jgi:hypothetical protein
LPRWFGRQSYLDQAALRAKAYLFAAQPNFPPPPLSPAGSRNVKTGAWTAAGVYEYRPKSAAIENIENFGFVLPSCSLCA